MTIHLVSLGCDKNLVDAEVMLGLLAEAGHTYTNDPAGAEAILVNTCSFIAAAAQEAIDTILEMAAYKQTGRCRYLAVTGCLVSRYERLIFSEIPEVDAIVGPGDYGRIGEALKLLKAGDKPAFFGGRDSRMEEGDALKRRLNAPSHFAYLKIAEGCDNHCTYCTIPSIRGVYRSRTLESLAAEGAFLAGQGVRELVLVAQDTSRYGTDLYGQSRLSDLLRQLSAIEGIVWIRLLYAYPEHLTDESITEMARNPKVCHYIDLPMQHADDALLKRMGRRSTQTGLRAAVGKLRAAMPDIAIRTTFITGFPGETEEQFANLLNFVREMAFDKVGVFPYSQEEGTPAAGFPGQLEEKVKKRRASRLAAAQKKISAAKLKGLVGQRLRVMVDGAVTGPDGGELYSGRSYRDCYEIDGCVYFPRRREILSGELVTVAITGSAAYDLFGEEEVPI